MQSCSSPQTTTPTSTIITDFILSEFATITPTATSPPPMLAPNAAQRYAALLVDSTGTASPAASSFTISCTVEELRGLADLSKWRRDRRLARMHSNKMIARTLGEVLVEQRGHDRARAEQQRVHRAIEREGRGERVMARAIRRVMSLDTLMMAEAEGRGDRGVVRVISADTGRRLDRDRQRNRDLTRIKITEVDVTREDERDGKNESELSGKSLIEEVKMKRTGWQWVKEVLVSKCFGKVSWHRAFEKEKEDGGLLKRASRMGRSTRRRV
jgi:hypothetical protein